MQFDLQGRVNLNNCLVDNLLLDSLWKLFNHKPQPNVSFYFWLWLDVVDLVHSIDSHSYVGGDKISWLFVFLFMMVHKNLINTLIIFVFVLWFQLIPGRFSQLLSATKNLLHVQKLFRFISLLFLSLVYQLLKWI